MESVILQMCAGDRTGPERLLDFEFVEAFTCTYADATGLLMLGLLFYGGISLNIYTRTGSIRVPGVMLLLTGGAIIGQVAAVGVTVATVALMLFGSGVFAYVYYRFSR